MARYVGLIEFERKFFIQYLDNRKDYYRFLNNLKFELLNYPVGTMAQIEITDDDDYFVFLGFAKLYRTEKGYRVSITPDSGYEPIHLYKLFED